MESLRKQYEEETGGDAFVSIPGWEGKDLPSDYYVEWLEKKLGNICENCTFVMNE